MEEERIGLVLDRASELRLKITNCMQKASTNNAKKDEAKTSENQESEAEEEDGDDDEEADRLLNIRDALEALEAQLSSLLALQQQQWYEKEASLAEIECSQKKLLKKLKEYKGNDLEVIREAFAFVGETEDENSDLLLPPYPSRPYFTSTCKFPQNGVLNNGDKDEMMKKIHAERQHKQSSSKGPFKGIKLLISAASKTAFTFAGVIFVLRLAGFEPRLQKRDNAFKVFGLFQQHEVDEKEATVKCPSGKIPVMEDGELRCLVKERVEIPFKSVVPTPDVNYGCG